MDNHILHSSLKASLLKMYPSPKNIHKCDLGPSGKNNILKKVIKLVPEGPKSKFLSSLTVWFNGLYNRLQP